VEVLNNSLVGREKNAAAITRDKMDKATHETTLPGSALHHGICGLRACTRFHLSDLVWRE
jgi:hypothetical protein